MPRTKQQFEAMRLATRAKIHSAAVKLFTQKGFAAAGVQDIAQLAGISTGLMYRHYKSKEELFGALLLEAATGLQEVARMLQRDMPPIDIITQLTEEILRDIAENDEFAQYMILITQAFITEDYLPQVQQLVEQNHSLIQATAELIEKGQRLDQFKQGNPLEMAFYYFSAVQGMAEMKFALKERFVTPRIKIVHGFLVKEADQGDAN